VYIVAARFGICTVPPVADLSFASRKFATVAYLKRPMLANPGCSPAIRLRN
jgi:hypothetical protein